MNRTQQFIKKIPIKAFIVLFILLINSYYLTDNFQNDISDPQLKEQMISTNYIAPFNSRNWKIGQWKDSLYFLDYFFNGNSTTPYNYQITNLTYNENDQKFYVGNNLTIRSNISFQKFILNDNYYIGLEDFPTAPRSGSYYLNRVYLFQNTYSNSSYYPTSELMVPCNLSYNGNNLTSCQTLDIQLTKDNLFLYRSYSYNSKSVLDLEIFNLKDNKILSQYIIPDSFNANYIEFNQIFILNGNENQIWLYYTSGRRPVLPGFFQNGFIRFDVKTQTFRNILEFKTDFNSISTKYSPLLGTSCYNPVFLGNKLVCFWQTKSNFYYLGYSFFSLKKHIVFTNVSINTLIFAVIALYIFSIYKWKNNPLLKKYHLI